jgi:hypothetical protein
MNRGLSFLSLVSIAGSVIVGCSGSDASTSQSPIADPVDAGPDGGPAIDCADKDCQTIPLSKLCGRAHTTLIKDGLPPDDASNALIQAALLANCAPPPMAMTLEKGAPGAIDPATGRPMAGIDDLLTVAGGAYVQKVVAYLDAVGATQLYLVVNPSTSSWQYVSRAGTVVAEMPPALFTTTHDIILIEFVRDPLSHTPVLIAFGQEAESTAAAAWFVAHEIVPNRARYDKSWYVYEWTSSATANGTMPTFTLKAASP